MDLASLFSLFRRQWRVVVPVTLVVGAMVVSTVMLRPPSQSASAIAVLLPPDQSGAVPASPSNPYTRLNDLSVVVDILTRVMSNDQTAEKLRAAGLQGQYVIAANVDFTRGPIIDIRTEAPSAEAAIGGATLVTAELNRQLKALQVTQGASPRDLITMQVVVPATRAVPLYSSTLRLFIALTLLGGGIVIAAAILADALGRRARRRSKEREPATVETA